MKFVNVGNDKMFRALSCVPALSDVSRTKSFDPSGSVAIGSEMLRITGILRNAGWDGIYFGKDSQGNGSYALDGSEFVSTSTVPFQSFELLAESGVKLIPYGSNLGSNIQINATGEIDLLTTGYGPRAWNQAIVGGERVFAGVENITGLSVGNTVLVRLGASATDFSGIWHSYFFGKIKSITPTGGTAGTVETWECCPEKSPTSAPGNPHRSPGRNDMIKIVGFQDNTTISGFCIDRCVIELVFYRNITIDCSWSEVYSGAINGLGGVGMCCPNLYVQSAHGASFPGSIVQLASQYDTHIGSFVINDFSPRSGSVFQILTEESDSRGVRVDYASVTYNDSDGSASSGQIFGQTPGQTDTISVGLLSIGGGVGNFYVGNSGYIDSVIVRGNPQNIFFAAGACGSILYNKQLYRQQVEKDYVMPIAASTTNVIKMAIHGLTSGLRIKVLSLTGVVSAEISGDNFVNTIDVTTEITANQWSDINDAKLLAIVRPNQPGYNSLSLRITTNGSAPAFNWAAIKHLAYEIDLSSAATSVTDTSVPTMLVSNGAPTANSDFIGQENFDSTNHNWYRSVAVGTGASDWKATT